MNSNLHGPDVIDRFMKKVAVTPGCWVWRATVDRYGYGQFHYKGRTKKAHRISYEIFKGSIPKGLDIDHTCCNRNCVAPSHLEPVTPQENTRRIWIRKRLELCTDS